MTISEKVIKAINNYVAENGYETWMSGNEVQDYVNSCFEDKIKNGSLQPTDYCYNIYNTGLPNFAERGRLLEYKEKQYRLLGENYPYTGDTWHRPKSKESYVVGRWENGEFVLYSKADVESIKEEEKLMSNALSVIESIEEDLESSGLVGEERIAVTKIRINQSVYRKGLLRRQKMCCLCGVSDDGLLIASHIKPWRVSDANEKVDFDNGLLLCPNHDRLFDLGYITFDNDGQIVISNDLSDKDRTFMNVNATMKIQMNGKSREYMVYHREIIFRDNGNKGK